jgi:hypothetical protein
MVARATLLFLAGCGSGKLTKLGELFLQSLSLTGGIPSEM